MRSMVSLPIRSRQRASPTYVFISGADNQHPGRIRKIQPVSRHHDRIRVYVPTHGAPPQKLAFHKRCARASHLIKNQILGRSVAQNEVSGMKGAN
ncbi:hypothetical protein METP1_01114 [Methanosarcinales archaeon]|nr:hypothetical protein METP1_01114 [Methanosarcinales archaeon]